MMRSWVRHWVCIGILALNAGVFSCVRPFSLRVAKKLCFFFFRAMYRTARITVEVVGDLDPTAHLYVANHTSYMDILFLGSLLQVPFIAKQEVRQQRFVGSVAAGIGGLFISRTRAQLLKELALLRKRLQQGDAFILFPEGGTGDGITLQPFKGAFLVAPPDKPLKIQPFAIVPTLLNGLPVTSLFKRCYSKRGKISLASHVKQMCRLGIHHVRIIAYPACNTSDYATRAELAEALWQQVATGMRTPVPDNMH